jgi:hypothetical protein
LFAFSLSPTLSSWKKVSLAKRVQFDSFSVREKVAVGRMKVKPPGCSF